MFDYALIMNYGLTPNGQSVDRLSYLYGWLDGMHD